MNKPTLIYDGDCNFCRRWINRWQSLTGAQIDYAPFQFVADRFPQISQEDFRKSVQFVELDGQIYSGAEAVFRTLAYTKGRRWLIGCYRNLPGFRLITEWFYNLVARNRILFSQLTRLLWGDDLSPPTYYKSSAAFIRILGIAYLVAFVSLWSQLTGLIGSSGILPASEFLT
ncbi:MAG: DUF393 domain-containing protein, partial [Candidatus Omnitrophica bacterium]|nr:DUF393 domain-containing protein [Candidatus Omnitrophota bacterium]